MARAKKVVQVELLRDQVYRLIRDDLKAGALEPGQRIVEVELADRYKVSRTPVREALFQLSRDGLLIAAPDRGYVVVVDTPLATTYRHEVRDLLDPHVARRAAVEGSPEQKKALSRAFERQRAAHEAGRAAAFVEANADFRDLLRAMCGNALMAQCSALVDDQAQWARRSAFLRPDYRALELEHNERISAAILEGDGAAAEAAMEAYIDNARQHLIPMLPDPSTTAAG